MANLDVAGLMDVLRMNGGEYSVADMIFSGVLDDEYPCTGGSPVNTPSPPDLTVTRTSTERTTSLYTRPPAARFSLIETPEGEPGPSWASRRAWIGGTGELMVYPGPMMDADRDRNRTMSLSVASGSGNGLGVSTPYRRSPTTSEDEHTSSLGIKRRSMSENGFATYIPPGVGYPVNPTPATASPTGGAPPSSWSLKGKQPAFEVDIPTAPTPIPVRSSDPSFTVTSRPRTSPDLPSLAKEARYSANLSNGVLTPAATPLYNTFASTVPSPPSPTIPTPARSSPLRNASILMAPELEKKEEKKYKFPSRKWWFAPTKVSLRLR